jgi:hypothetical protein
MIRASIARNRDWSRYDGRMKFPFAFVTIALLASTAAADPPPKAADVAQSVFTLLVEFDSGPDDAGVQRFGFLPGGTSQADQLFDNMNGAAGGVDARNVLVATAASGDIAWVSADLDEYGYCGSCGPSRGKPVSFSHGTILLDKGPAWHSVAWDVTFTATDADQAKAAKAGIVPPALTKKVDAGAEAAEKLFEGSLADPAAFAATVSDRKDALLYGSNVAERYVGGAKIKAQLKAWNLKLAVRDGVQAGAVGTTIAWVAANLDATAIKSPKTPSSPYRVFAIYEKTGDSWKLVLANFGFVRAVNAPPPRN